MILSLPRDRVYAVYLTADEDQVIMYYGAEYHADQINAKVSEINYIDMKKGEMYLISSLSDDAAAGDTQHLWGSVDFSVTMFDEETPYTPSLMTQTENFNVFHLTFVQMIWVAAGAIVLVLVLIVLTVVLIVRHHKRRKKQALPAELPARGAEGKADEEKTPSGDDSPKLPM